MSGKIYKLWMAKPKEADYQSSQEEESERSAKVVEALERVGGKRVLVCYSRWSSEEWTAFGIEEFPDIEAVQEFTQHLEELDHYRYLEVFSLLGTEWQSD